MKKEKLKTDRKIISIGWMDDPDRKGYTEFIGEFYRLDPPTIGLSIGNVKGVTKVKYG